MYLCMPSDLIKLSLGFSSSLATSTSINKLNCWKQNHHIEDVRMPLNVLHSKVIVMPIASLGLNTLANLLKEKSVYLQSVSTNVQPKNLECVHLARLRSALLKLQQMKVLLLRLDSDRSLSE